jgi:hypothetical protein
MKILFLNLSLVFVCSFPALSQKEIEKKLKDELWTNAPPEFKATEVPEKYKNESAVFLAISIDYTLSDLKYYVEKANIHFRIKLLDKAAINEYSELSFDKKNINTNIFGKASSYSIVAAKIIKPGGAEKELDLTAAVKTDAGSSKDFKIAIPNLEVGDIIDYFIGMKAESYSLPDLSQCDVLNEKHPVVKRTLKYQIPDAFILNSMAYNGAPDFKKSVNGKNLIYTLTDDMRDKDPDIMWAFDHRSAPEIRYFLTGAKKTADKEKEAREALDTYNLAYADIGFIIDYMNGNFKKESDQKKIVYELFYLLRNPIYMKAYFQVDQGKPIEAGSAPNLFFTLMCKSLTKYKIPFEIMLVPARHYGPLKSMVNFSSCDFLIKVNTSPAIYIPRMNPLNSPDEVNYLLEDMSGVSKKMYPADPLPAPKEEPIKASSLDMNSTEATFQISINGEDKSRLMVKREILAKGFNKQYYQYLVFTNYDYLKEYDQPKYQVQSSSLFRSLIKDYNIEKKKFEQRVAQDYNARDKLMLDDLENEFEVKVSDYKNLHVKSIGMWDSAPNTSFSDEYVLENMSKKAGPNLILEIGKLIGMQTEVKEEQKTRTRDIDMNNARSFYYTISFTVPEGYTVEGYENLNKKVENSSGGFSSNAKLEGNMLVVKTKKYYTKNHFPASEWPRMVEFMDAAISFRNSKILLKKK